ncbi:hypothetical protein IMSHALPRED_005474 [Imshaugia aleurites]|uniref:Uncharacterized protein n=1 Tax=Imshaugia aleurites TaxID=172621 RepID=A0A8H3EIJ5_9LECA|nr:hypothetical protein IMSHALPRED_005474 [Imshaugia aleurites]
MRCTHVLNLAFVLAVMKIPIAKPVLAFQSQPETEPSFDSLALGPTTGQSITTSRSLQTRDLDRACSKDLRLFSDQISTLGLKCNAKPYSHVRAIPRSEAGYSPSVSERSLISDLAKTGFRLVWDCMDIAYASYIAFHQTTKLWANITANARGKWKAEQEMMTLDISYGSLKLSIAGLIDVISWELVADFAAQILVLSRILVFGSFMVLVLANAAAMVITLAIAVQILDSVRPHQLVTGP